MTLLGKILVCVTLAISLMMAAFGIGVYTQRINWTDKPREATAEQPQGELARLQKEIYDPPTRGGAWGGLLLAEARQQEALARLRTVEAQRPLDQQWYAQQLAHMDKGADDKRPVQLLVFQEGRLLLDDKNPTRPALRDGTDRAKQPLRSLESYLKGIDEHYKLIAAEREKLDKRTEEAAKLTEQLIGVKGLRQRVEDEDDKRERVAREIEDFVKPSLINVQVESGLLLKRRDALRDRVEELKKAPVASGR
jgi:hypothetical protein